MTVRLSRDARIRLYQAGITPKYIESELNSGNYGNLMRYEDAKYLRPATLDEALESYEAIQGIFTVENSSVYVEM